MNEGFVRITRYSEAVRRPDRKLPISPVNAPLLRSALVTPEFLALFNPARSERVSSVRIVVAAWFV